MFGRVAGEYMAKSLNGKGNVLALRGIPRARQRAIRRLEGGHHQGHPDIKLLDAKFGNWNRDDAFKVTQDFLTRFKDIDAIWAADDDMAVGVMKAIDQAKRTDIKDRSSAAPAPRP